MISVFVLALVSSLLVLALFRAELNKAEFARKTWEELVQELRPVNTDGITLTALECGDADGAQLSFGRDEIWMMIGGWEGLNRMQANARLLVALAAHAGLWNPRESLTTAEQMRSDAKSVHRAVGRIRLERFFSLGNSLFSSNVLEPTCAYYRMSERLLTLHERSPSRRYAQLTAAVWPRAETAGASLLPLHW